MYAGLMQRAIGTLVLGLVGWQVGNLIGNGSSQPRNTIIGIAAGAIIGFVLAPLLVTRPYHGLRQIVRRAPVIDLGVGIMGLILGLVVGALLSYPLSLLPGWLGHILPAATAAICGYLGVTLLLMRRRELIAFVQGRRGDRAGAPSKDPPSGYLVDTSAIIDGRIADISATGFLLGTLLVPRFVLHELQNIAGSADALRRARGRRGLEILNRMQKDSGTPVEVTELDAPTVRDVDSKLVQVAREIGCPVVTNDFNLNRVAELQGVRVLNVNQLANAVKPHVLPGEHMEVRIIQEGKEVNQGVGYLDDGTMIVVENGRRHLNNEVNVVVTRVLQTVAGRMIFAQPSSNGHGSPRE